MRLHSEDCSIFEYFKGTILYVTCLKRNFNIRSIFCIKIYFMVWCLLNFYSWMLHYIYMCFYSLEKNIYFILFLASWWVNGFIYIVMVWITIIDFCVLETLLLSTLSIRYVIVSPRVLKPQFIKCLLYLYCYRTLYFNVQNEKRMNHYYNI